jgi:hypothetical protein
MELKAEEVRRSTLRETPAMLTAGAAVGGSAPQSLQDLACDLGLHYRASWFCFAWLMARTRTRLSWLITPVWGTSHLFLLVILLQAFPGLSH